MPINTKDAIFEGSGQEIKYLNWSQMDVQISAVMQQSLQQLPSLFLLMTVSRNGRWLCVQGDDGQNTRNELMVRLLVGDAILYTKYAILDGSGQEIRRRHLVHEVRHLGQLWSEQK